MGKGSARADIKINGKMVKDESTSLQGGNQWYWVKGFLLRLPLGYGNGENTHNLLGGNIINSCSLMDNKLSIHTSHHLPRNT
jgi:hypothetical protein